MSKERKIIMDMKISSVYSVYNIHNTNSIPGQKKAANAERAESKDSFTLSSKAEDYQAVRKALSQVPDVREDKISRLQAGVSSGSYQVNASEIAAKILQGFI
jgi:negative regulator of flagellin synthesis FlgM